MDLCSVYLIEGGFPKNLPGIGRELPSASFPFWSNYSFLDFALTNFGGLAEGGCTVVAGSHFRSLQPFFGARSQSAAERLVGVEGEIDGFAELLREEASQTVLICPLSLVCTVDREALQAQIQKLSVDILKLSLNKTAVDLYLAKKKALLDAVESCRRRGTSRAGLGPALFEEVLHTSFEAIHSIPGDVLFQNSLMQMFSENIWLAQASGTPQMVERLNLIRKSRSTARQERDILIDKGGEVRNSFLAPGVRVEGNVEGSVLFPDVVVHKGATVQNSVILNGNRIGARAQVYKSLILPYLGDNGRGVSNIGENASIGARQSGARNFDYPNQIREGLTVLGTGCEVPRGYVIGPGCLVGAGVSAQELRASKELKKGSSILRRRN